jgi:glycosyltransferase involved in cell wall biosynthesis
MVRNMETLDWNDQNDPIRHRVATRLRRLEGHLAARSAQRLIAVSEYVREFLIEKWRVNPAMLSVVYHGVDDPDDVHESPAKPDSVPDFTRFIFTAGSTKPSRGLEDLLAAVAQLPEPRPALVVAGRAEPPFGGYEQALRGRAQDISNGATIFWAGMLASHEMAWCYRHADLFVMTSRVEACPNIALEAMSFGCPSIAANNKPLPEMYGDAATYYQPRRPESLAGQITDLMRQPDRRAALSNAARARALGFTWSRCAEGTAQALTLAMSDWHGMKRSSSH